MNVHVAFFDDKGRVLAITSCPEEMAPRQKHPLTNNKAFLKKRPDGDPSDYKIVNGAAFYAPDPNRTAGTFGTSGSMAVEVLRAERDAILDATDYFDLPNSGFSDAERSQIAVYRQALRDSPSTGSLPNLDDYDMPERFKQKVRSVLGLDK